MNANLFFAVQNLHHVTAGDHCPKHLILLAVPHPPSSACGPPIALEHACRRTFQTAQNSVRLTVVPMHGNVYAYMV